MEDSASGEYSLRRMFPEEVWEVLFGSIAEEKAADLVPDGISKGLKNFPERMTKENTKAYPHFLLRDTNLRFHPTNAAAKKFLEQSQKRNLSKNLLTGMTLDIVEKVKNKVDHGM